MREPTTRPDQHHFFADLDETPLLGVDAIDEHAAPASVWQDAWRSLRRRPLFWVSAVLIVVVLAVAIAPSLFTSIDPNARNACTLEHSLEGPSSGHPMGYTFLGCDVYARVIYGARPSVSVGVLTTIIVVLIGVAVGALAGFFGGWFDSLLSRVTDIFFAIPFVLAAIVVMSSLKSHRGVMTVVIVLGVFGWPQVARITRGAVLGLKNSDFVTASTALGTSRMATLRRHILPNAAAPIIVYATVALGTFIVAEATLSFLGIGLPDSVISWGGDISNAQRSIRTDPMVLFWPAAALAITVLSFIMMGDVVRDALDPKARKR